MSGIEVKAESWKWDREQQNPKASFTARLFRRFKKKTILFVLAMLFTYFQQLLQQSLIKNNVLRGADKHAYSSRELTEKTIAQFIGGHFAHDKNQ